MKPVNERPQFLRIRWEDQRDNFEATLCLRHRQEIALKYQSARGCGQLGDSCDLCDGWGPTRV